MQEEIFDFWKFLAGIGLFLWGMQQLESSLKELAGQSFRNLLQKYTNTTFKGILTGALITAVLQSSSLVTLMVLAFSGAGVLSLRNAMGVVLGANLGTTITGWIVAALGFKLSVADLSMPFIGLGSLLFLFFSQRPVIKNLGAFSVGFGLLFLGLDFMKTAIEEFSAYINLDEYQAFGLWVYLLIGIVLTALIQSSSAMVVIILSAISANVIGLTEGAVLIIGSNIGTTVTTAIGAINGVADKKRLALTHFLFNFITGLIVFAFISPLIDFTVWLFSVRDPIIELVLLNTMINIIGIILFFPVINTLEHWLQGRFGDDEPKGISSFIKYVDTKVPEAALHALEKDIALAFDMTIDFMEKVWDGGSKGKVDLSLWKKIIQQPYDLLTQYKNIKSLEDELTTYHISLQEEILSESDANKLTYLMQAMRNMVYAEKDIKDIIHNLKEMEHSGDLMAKATYESLEVYTFGFIKKLKKFLSLESAPKKSPNWIGENSQEYQILMAEIYQHMKKGQPDIPLSTLSNVIKQVISSLDNLAIAVIHWKLQLKMEIDLNHEG